MASLIGLDSTSSGFDPGLQHPPLTFGVWGDSGGADGVVGSSNTGVGVFGRSMDAAAAAVKGASDSGTGVEATSAGGTALHAHFGPDGGAAVTEAFLATSSLAADFRGDVAITGNVAVGLPAQQAKRPLHVEGSQIHSGGAQGGLSFADRTGGSFVENPTNGERWVWYAQDGTARLWSGTDRDRLTIDKNGNLGIGTTMPTAKLHVNGSEEQVRVQGPATGSANVAYVSFADSAGTRVGYVGDGSTSDESVFLSADRGDVVLETAAGRILTVSSNGNVGIGTTTPDAASVPQQESVKLVVDPQGPGGIVVGNPNTGSGGFTSLLMEISAATDGSGRIQAIKSSGSAWGDLALNPFGGNVDIGPGGLNVTATTGDFATAITSTGKIGVLTEGVIGISAVSTSGGTFAGLFNGDVSVSGTLKKGFGQFQIDHPLDPANKLLYHSAVESDEMKNLYDGVAELDADGRAEVVLPDWFEALNESFRYQLTPIGTAAPDLHIADELHNGQFTIAGGHPNMTVCWLVSGVRHDAYAQAHPMQVEVPKSPEEAGWFLHPEEHGEPAERSLATLLTQSANDSRHG